jgi:hypothetical protein
VNGITISDVTFGTEYAAEDQAMTHQVFRRRISQRLVIDVLVIIISLVIIGIVIGFGVGVQIAPLAGHLAAG